MQNSLVSIILPVYNGENYISQTIESCINQTYENWELIIVDDCSKDNTDRIIASFEKKYDRIKSLRNSSNKKLPETLNEGHKIALGDYITWISHDNIFKNDFLEKMVIFLNTSFADIVYSNFEIIDQDANIGELRELDHSGKLLIGNTVQASFLYKRKVFELLNGYRDLFLVEDYDFWLRASMQFSIKYYKENLYYFRQHESSLTSEIAMKPNVYKNYKNVLLKCYNTLNNDFFSAESSHILTLIHLRNFERIENLPFGCVKHFNKAIEEIELFCVKFNYDQFYYKSFITNNIRRMILDGRIKINFLTLLYLIINKPRWFIEKKYDYKQLLKAYFK